MASSAEALVVGHICLDIIPDLASQNAGRDELLKPGTLSKIGPAMLSTGGAVPNTGLALHRLGIRTQLMGKVGDDAFGEIILGILRRHALHLADSMIISAGEHTSYSLVISPPNIDRCFLHHTGTNDSFTLADVPFERFAGARLLHFGYPPLMRGFYSDGGRQLAELFRRARQQGLTTCLDMVQFDRGSEAGRVDWPGLLRETLPQVDLFLPSLDEILAMTAPVLPLAGPVSGETLSRISSLLIEMGAPIVVLKLGCEGLYLRTTSDRAALARVACVAADQRDAWLGRELVVPCFCVEVVGTTGAGDSAIAGFEAAVLRGQGPEAALSTAAAVGACCVEQADATSGIPSWDQLQARLSRPWPRREVSLPLRGWRWNCEKSLATGPNDKGTKQ